MQNVDLIMEGFWRATSQFVSKSEARVGRNGRARGSERDRDIDTTSSGTERQKKHDSPKHRLGYIAAGLFLGARSQFTLDYKGGHNAHATLRTPTVTFSRLRPSKNPSARRAKHPSACKAKKITIANLKTTPLPVLLSRNITCASVYITHKT